MMQHVNIAFICVHETRTLIKYSVGVPRIELGLTGPKPDVLPVYYTPTEYLIPSPDVFRKKGFHAS